MSNWREVHERLSTTLPSRFHVHPEPKVQKKARKGKYTGQGAHNRIALIVDGKEYYSLTMVKKVFHVTRETIYDWIRSGRAVKMVRE